MASSSFMIPSPDLFPERKHGSNRHLEMLQSPGNSHDGHAEKKAEEEVNEGDLPPAAENPDEIHHHRHAARLFGTIHQLMAKGPQCISAQLEQLHAKGYADERDAHQQSNNIVDNGNDNTAKQKPEYIAKKLHSYSCFNAFASWSGQLVPRPLQSIPSRRPITSLIFLPSQSLASPCVFPAHPLTILTLRMVSPSVSMSICVEQVIPQVANDVARTLPVVTSDNLVTSYIVYAVSTSWNRGTILPSYRTSSKKFVLGRIQ